MNSSTAVLTAVCFLIAAVCEIGGCYLIWQAVKGQQGWMYATAGAVLLVAYGCVAAFQPLPFGRTFAAYGGIFIIGSFAASWILDGVRPDPYDITGCCIILLGILVLLMAHRGPAQQP